MWSCLDGGGLSIVPNEVQNHHEAVQSDINVMVYVFSRCHQPLTT